MIEMTQEEFEVEIAINKKGFYYTLGGCPPGLPHISDAINYEYVGSLLTSEYLTRLFHLKFERNFVWCDADRSDHVYKLIKLIEKREANRKPNVIFLHNVTDAQAIKLKELGFEEFCLK